MIRTATADDADALGRCHLPGWRASCAHVLPADVLAGLRLEDFVTSWQAALTEPDHGILLAEDAGTVIGFARTGPTPDPRPSDDPVPGELRALYVAPDHWGTGIAAELHAAALAALVGAGHRTAVLWVVEGNERAIRFYRRRGWRRDGWERVKRSDGHPWTELRLRGSLTS